MKIRMIGCALVVVAALFLAEAPDTRAETEPLGVRLAATIETGTTDTLRIRVSLENRTSSPIPLAALVQNNSSINDYLLESLRFDVSPDVYHPTWQTSVGRQTTLSLTLPANDAYHLEWSAPCGCLKSGRYMSLAQCLVEPGLYQLAARIPRGTFYLTEDLVSNVVEVQFGGEKQPPKPTMFKIAEVDDVSNLAVLSGGREHGVQSGQLFVYRASLAGYWTFRVLEARGRESTAEIDYVEGANRPDFWPRETTFSLVSRRVWRRDTELRPCVERLP